MQCLEAGLLLKITEYIQENAMHRWKQVLLVPKVFRNSSKKMLALAHYVNSNWM